MKPNLFKYATSELSQDAFILWLLEWANPECATEDKALHETAQEFVRLLLENKDLIIETINTKRQKNHIDVFAIVNDKYAVIIEDKTDTSEHNNQMARYEKWVSQQKEYSDLEKYIVYYKRGNESYFKLNKMTEKYASMHFTILTRKDILSVLTKCTTTNVIYCDYVEYIQDIQQQTEAYKSLPINKWSPYTWQGFYMALEKELQIGDWKYVPNKQGGFWGFYWHYKAIKPNPSIELYLQFEQDKLCVKAYDKAGGKNGIKYSNLLNKIAKEQNVPLKKPKKRRSGTYMTLAVLELSKSEIINMPSILKQIKEIELFVDYVKDLL